MIGLAQVADRAADSTGARDPVAIRRIGPEELNDPDDRVDQPGTQHPSEEPGGDALRMTAVRPMGRMQHDHRKDHRRQRGPGQRRRPEGKRGDPMPQTSSSPTAATTGHACTTKARAGTLVNWPMSVTTTPQQAIARHWLSSVGDGGTLSASTVGSTVAMTSAHCAARSTPRVCIPRLDRAYLGDGGITCANSGTCFESSLHSLRAAWQCEVLLSRQIRSSAQRAWLASPCSAEV